MFNLRKRVENLENQLKINPVVITKSDLYKFYLDRRMEQINTKLTNKITYRISETIIPGLFYTPGIEIDISLGDNIIFRKELSYHDLKEDISTVEYKIILNYLNKKSISYFIKLDKKIEEIKKKQLNLEEELKKFINKGEKNE